MRHLAALPIYVLAIACTASTQAQITSTSAGGNWREASTWIGGTIPAAGDDVVVDGPVVVRSGDRCHDLLVRANGSITDLVGGSFFEDLEVLGRAENHGTVAPTGRLTMLLHGDLHNEGTWHPNRTEFLGVGDQFLSVASGAHLQGDFYHGKERGALAAASDLALSDATWHLRNDTLEMRSHALWTGRNVVLYDATILGPVTLRGRMQANSSMRLSGQIVVQDTLEGYPAGAWVDHLYVDGVLVNEGVVRNGDQPFAIYLDGSIHNAGEWTAGETVVAGTTVQHLSHEPGAPFEGDWTVADSATISAGSPLAFTGSNINLRRGRLEMGPYPLTLRASTLRRGTLAADTLTAHDGGALAEALHVATPIRLQGTVHVYSGTVFEQAVTVADTLRDGPSGAFIEDLVTHGTIRNEGVVTGDLYVYAHGSIINEGTWRIRNTYLAGLGPRTIRGNRIESPVTTSGEGVVLTGDISLNSLRIGGVSHVRLSGEASLSVPAGGLEGHLTYFTSFGRVITHREAAPRRRVDFFDGRLVLPSDLDIDTVRVVTHGHQVPSTYGAAVRNWWRLIPSPHTTLTLPELELDYRDDQLGPNDEAALEVYHSDDVGASWTRISTSENTRRDPANNRITLQNVPATGDYVLSSVTEPTSTAPSVVISITGRTNIRAGAPNRYLVHYVNNGDRPTGDMLMAIGVASGGHILRIEPSGSTGDGAASYGPDDLFAADVTGDTLAMLVARSMDPREERSFVVVATADAALAAKTDAVEAAPLAFVAGLVILAGEAAVFVGKVAMVAFVFDAMSRTCKEFFVDRRGMLEALSVAIDKTAEKWGHSAELALKDVAQALGVEAVERGLKAPSNITSFVQTTVQCFASAGLGLKSLVSEFWGDRFEPVYRRECSTDWGGSHKRTVPARSMDASTCPAAAAYRARVVLPVVRSWDPNEKTGPSGVGASGFMSTVGRMHYTMLFENKAEATAAAYRVVIRDTLTDAFAPETVRFAGESHSGFVAERTGHVLTWSIEGIELPPNVHPPEGEGFVSFSVEVHPSLPSTSPIENRATIVFDANPPITTNTVVHTLDLQPPETVMQPLASRVEGNAVMVRWNSTDDASGIDVTHVFAARESEPFRLVGTTAADSMMVSVDAHGTYRFYALAIDRVGNAETTHPPSVSTEVVAVDVDERSPRTFALWPNYPNPFHASTTISFDLPEGGDVELVLYDVLGRRVTTLLKERLLPGRHQVPVDVGLLASGIYFYQIRVGNLGRLRYRDVRSLVLVR